MQLRITRKYNVMLYYNTSDVIVYCITYSIKTICYTYEYVNMFSDSSLQDKCYVITYGVHGAWGVYPYVYIPNDRDGVF